MPARIEPSFLCEGYYKGHRFCIKWELSLDEFTEEKDFPAADRGVLDLNRKYSALATLRSVITAVA